jgi:hypothetical protein
MAEGTRFVIWLRKYIAGSNPVPGSRTKMPNPKKLRPPCLCGCSGELAKASRKFYSNQCQKIYQRKVYIERWLLGLESGGNVYGVSSYVRNYLYELRGEKCDLCGWNQVNLKTEKSPLEIDHIDGNHKNNYICNLKILCPNCHSLTSTYKALNKGNGRSFRK